MRTLRQYAAWLALLPLLLSGCAVASASGTAPSATPKSPTPGATPTPTTRTARSGGNASASPQPTITCPAGATDPNGGYGTCTFTGADGSTMTFYLYIPANYDPQQQYPLVLLLQGGGERAQAGASAAANASVILSQQYVAVWGPGYPSAQTSVQNQWPSFIVVPQVVYPGQFVDTPANQGSYTLASQPTTNLLDSMEIVSALQAQYPTIDPNRLYITGISMGGYGVWDAIERWPTYFAAAGPVSGAGDPTLAAEVIHLPIWDFHASADPIVPTSGSLDMMAALRAAGGQPCYTEYDLQGHTIWPLVYSVPTATDPGSGFFAWLFAQRRGQVQSGPQACAVS